MAWQSQYELTCDGYAELGFHGRCPGGSGFTAASRKRTLDAALARGWVESRGRHYCPACWPVIQERRIRAMYPDQAQGGGWCDAG